MSSDQDKKAATNDNKGSSGDKQAPPGDNTGAKKADSQNVPSSGGHEETGPEKFASTGGSGGVPMRTGQGFEAYAQH
jgi:hypothetical protein